MSGRISTKDHSPSPKEQRDLCLRILLWLVRQEEKAVRNEYSEKVTALRQGLLNNYPPVGSAHLERLFATASDNTIELGERQFLYFQAGDQGGIYIPVVKLRFDYEDDRPEFRLRVVFFGGEDSASYGYRFETPEGSGGVHDFYHVQPIRGFDKGGPLDADGPTNASQPSIPVDADSPVTLLLAVVVACYGLRYLRTVLVSPEFQRLRPYLEHLHWPPPALK